jgi:predicted RNA binding protein YcfA (HicA-like mRNA interferase family)
VRVSRYGKTLQRLLSGTADQTLRFDELCNLLSRLGFADRQRGSHRIFSRDGIAEILNLQPRPDGTAKPYQVRQVRDVILRYRLAVFLVREPDDA